MPKHGDSSQKNRNSTSNPNFYLDAGLKFASALTAGLIELVTLYPLDTWGTRIKNHKGDIWVWNDSMSANFNRFKGVINSGGSYYSGLRYKALDKLLVKRTYKYSVQDGLEKYLVGKFEHNYGKIAIATASGSIVALGEVVFLPADYIPTNLQKDRNVFKNQSWGTIFKNSYAGVGVTSLRNFFGGGLLFGTRAYVYENVYKLENPKKEAVFYQKLFANLLGAIFSVVPTMPVDVVKTRLQIKRAEEKNCEKEGIACKPVSTTQFMKDMYRTEGGRAFFKGTAVKTINTSFKICLSLTLYDYILNYMQAKTEPYRQASPTLGSGSSE